MYGPLRKFCEMIGAEAPEPLDEEDTTPDIPVTDASGKTPDNLLLWF